MRVHKSPPTRKQQFRAALALAGMTVEQFCEEQSVTRTHLHLVLSGERESARLTEEVEAFITRHLRAFAA